MFEIVVFAAMLATAVWLAYSAGQDSERARTTKEMMNAIDKAIEARDSVKSPDDARRVLLEHAVQLPSVQDPKAND